MATSTAARRLARPLPGSPVGGSPLPAAPLTPERATAWQPREGWLAVALLLVMVGSVVWSIDQAQWAEGTGMLLPMALAGVLVSYVLARSTLAGWIGVLLGLVLGLAVTFTVVGQLLPPPSQMLTSFGQMVGGTLAWPWHRETLPPLLDAIGRFFTGATEFGDRINQWAVQGTSGNVNTDNAMFLLFIGNVAWIQGFLGGWGLFRLRDVVVAALPSGIALATNATYTGRAQGPFIIFIITLLLLAVSLNLVTLQRRWNRFDVDYPNGLLFDVTVSSFIVICLLAVLAFFGPRPGENPLSNAFWEYMGEQWGEVENASNRLFAGVNSPSAVGAGSGRDRLVLSGPVHLSQRVVMQVQSDEPYYWRGATYDTWTGHDWLTSEKVANTRSEKQAVLPQRFTQRKRVKVTFNINESRSDLIYTPDEPVQLSIPYKLFGKTNDNGVPDFSALRAKRPAVPDLRYSVDALVSVASADDLRNAPTDLPDWVKQPYLQLPDVPQRVRDLSNQLTRSRRTNYDKAVAIEQFLRRYPYTLDVKAPPPDRDAVEYFLFDLKQGYCDYFASAMVVLLRAQGIPARLATGYVSGKFDNNTQRFVVTEEEAHSWPEVYFPNYGWVAFEPSGYRPPIIRPEQSTAQANGDFVDCYEYGDCEDMGSAADLAGLILPNASGNLAVGATTGAGLNINWLELARNVGLTVVLLAAIGWLLSWLSSRQQSNRSLARRTYRQMSFYSGLFGLKPRPSQTPLEYAQSLTHALEQTLSQEGTVSRLRLRELVGAPNGAAEMIASSYVRSLYGQEELTERDRERLIEGWHEIRFKLPVLLFRDRRN